LTDKKELELFYALRTLHNYGILESAVAFFLENRIEVTFVNLRHFFYSQQIIDLLRISGRKLNILEIGGGNLQIILRLRLKSIFNSYTVIDIPKFLVLNAFCTSEFFRSIRLSFPKKYELINSENSNLFISSGEYSDFFETNKDLYFDLVLNTQSFMEMSNYTVSDYFNLIYERANTNCIFFNQTSDNIQCLR